MKQSVVIPGHPIFSQNVSVVPKQFKFLNFASVYRRLKVKSVAALGRTSENDERCKAMLQAQSCRHKADLDAGALANVVKDLFDTVAGQNNYRNTSNVATRTGLSTFTQDLSRSIHRLSVCLQPRANIHQPPRS
jgi:hypothetical protein